MRSISLQFAVRTLAAALLVAVFASCAHAATAGAGNGPSGPGPSGPGPSSGGHSVTLPGPGADSSGACGDGLVLAPPSPFGDGGDAVKALSRATETVHQAMRMRHSAMHRRRARSDTPKRSPSSRRGCRRNCRTCRTSSHGRRGGCAARRTRAEAVKALHEAIAVIHKDISLVRAEDPAMQQRETRSGGFVAETLNVASLSLEKARRAVSAGRAPAKNSPRSAAALTCGAPDCIRNRARCSGSRPWARRAKSKQPGCLGRAVAAATGARLPAPCRRWRRSPLSRPARRWRKAASRWSSATAATRRFPNSPIRPNDAKDVAEALEVPGVQRDARRRSRSGANAARHRGFRQERRGGRRFAVLLRRPRPAGCRPQLSHSRRRAAAHRRRYREAHDSFRRRARRAVQGRAASISSFSTPAATIRSRIPTSRCAPRAWRASATRRDF